MKKNKKKQKKNILKENLENHLLGKKIIKLEKREKKLNHQNSIN